MKGVVKELRGSFPELLQRKRAGVVAAALAAAARTGTGQVELAQALAAALRELPGNTQVSHPLRTAYHAYTYIICWLCVSVKLMYAADPQVLVCLRMQICDAPLRLIHDTYSEIQK